MDTILLKLPSSHHKYRNTCPAHTSMMTFLSHMRAACCRALMTDRYASFMPVYLPTITIVTVSRRPSHRVHISRHCGITTDGKW